MFRIKKSRNSFFLKIDSNQRIKKQPFRLTDSNQWTKKQLFWIIDSKQWIKRQRFCLNHKSWIKNQLILCFFANLCTVAKVSHAIFDLTVRWAVSTVSCCIVAKITHLVFWAFMAFIAFLRKNCGKKQKNFHYWIIWLSIGFRSDRCSILRLSVVVQKLVNKPPLKNFYRSKLFNLSVYTFFNSCWNDH